MTGSTTVNEPKAVESLRSIPHSLMLDCAAGAASPAVELLIATHLSMSEESRHLYGLMETIGGALLDDQDGETIDQISSAAALLLLDQESQDMRAAGLSAFQNEPTAISMSGHHPKTIADQDLPTPLHVYQAVNGGDWCWQRLGLGVAAAALTKPDAEERAHLLWAQPQTKIARHRHVGREVVLVLKGAFWDQGVRFGPGDVAVSEDGSIHGPRIDEGDDCLCLAVTEAPVDFVGPMGWAFNRFCRF